LIERLLKLIEAKEKGKHTVFAKKAGIPISTFQNYLNGRPIHVKHLLRIRETYNVNLDWLLTGEGQMCNEKEEPIQPAREMRPEVYAEIAGDYVDVDVLLKAAHSVLTSGNPMAADALKRNILYFSHAIQMERRMVALEQRLLEVEELVKKNRHCADPDHTEDHIEKKAM